MLIESEEWGTHESVTTRIDTKRKKHADGEILMPPLTTKRDEQDV